MDNDITLIVGGGGFIGSALVHEMISVNPERRIRVLGRSIKPINSLPNSVEYMQGSAVNISDVKIALEGVNKVVDLAYSTVPKTSFEDPLNDVTSNIPTSVNLLQLSSKHSLESYLLVSSGGTVYGQSTTLTINELHPTNPISPYGISKLLTEKYGHFFFEMSRLPLVIARPANPYGTNQIGLTQQGFIGATIGNILNNKTIHIFGKRGTIRDYIYIADLARGLRLCLDNGKNGETYNLGTGIGHNNYEVVEIIRSTLGKSDARISIEEDRPFDVKRNILDSTKAESELGWVCQTNLINGIEKLCKVL